MPVLRASKYCKNGSNPISDAMLPPAQPLKFPIVILTRFPLASQLKGVVDVAVIGHESLGATAICEEHKVVSTVWMVAYCVVL